MKKLFAIATVLAVLPAVSMSVSANDANAVQQQCAKAAKKDHVSADKMDAYVKSCVEKHSAKHADPAVPAAPAK